MSTRGAITRVTGDSFKGVYHHWDSYPEGLGSTLVELYQGHFKRDLPAMLRYLIDEHPAGWSTINGKDFNLAPGFLPHDYKAATMRARQPEPPECYCHGSHSEAPQVITEENASASGVEYVYAFNEETNHMFILSSYNEDGSKMIGMFGSGNPNATWGVIEDVDLTKPRQKKVLA